MTSAEDKFYRPKSRPQESSGLCIPTIEVNDYSTTHAVTENHPFVSSDRLCHLRVPPQSRTIRSASFQLTEPPRHERLAKKLSNRETARKVSSASSSGDGAWVQAAQNLQDALSVAPARRKNSLQILLKEVGKNENVTAQELIEKLRATPKEEVKRRRNTLIDWSPLKNFRKTNKAENLLSVFSEVPSKSGPRSDTEKSPTSESELDRSSSSVESEHDENRPEWPNRPSGAGASDRASPTAFFQTNALEVPKIFFDADEVADERSREGSPNDEVYVPITRKMEHAGPEQYRQIEQAQEAHGDEEEITQLLANVAEGMASSGPNFENLIKVLQYQTVQDNLNSVVDYALHTLQEQWATILDALVPMEKIQTMLFVCLIQTVTLQQALKAIPILTCYISFWIMIYSTLNLFHTSYWSKEAEKWRRLFRIFTAPAVAEASDTEEDPKSPNSSCASLSANATCSLRVDSKRLVQPHLNFFGALAIFLFSESMSNGHIPNALCLSALSFVFAILACGILNDQWKKLSYLCVFLTFLALLPNLLKKFNAQTHAISSVMERRVFEIIFGNIRMICSIPAFLMAIVSIMHFALLCRCYTARLDFIELILPHLVCLTWWKTTIELLLIGQDGLGWQNVALTIGMLWLVFFPTGATLGFVVFLIFTQVSHSVNFITLLKIAFTLSILFLPFVYDKIRRYLADHAWFSSLFSNKSGQQKTKRFIIYAILVFTSVIFIYQGNSRSSQEKIDLPWPLFEKRCSESALKELKQQDVNGNFLQAQIECNELRGAVVQWEGRVRSVEITSVENFFRTLFSYLPYSLAQRLRCFYGDDSKAEENSTTSGYMPLRRCSLSSSNVYTFKIDVESISENRSAIGVCDRNEIGKIANSAAKDQAVVQLTASHGFKDLVLDLRRMDLVRFTASFGEDVALKYPTEMILHNLKCLRCKREADNSTVTSSVHGGEEGIWGQLYYALCSVFNFVFSPLIVAG